MAAIGWYGPLIDLSQAASHIGDFVQLLAFVHQSRPIQRSKHSNGGALLKTIVQVGDDTRPFFPLSVWQKHIGSAVSAGDIILLQNAKIVKFGDTLEAVTVQFSSLLTLVHPYELLDSTGINELHANCRVGRTTNVKLKKVLEWMQQNGHKPPSVQHPDILSLTYGLPLVRDVTLQTRQASKNWKTNEERKSHLCNSISEVLSLANSCNATFYASVGEIFLTLTRKPNGQYEMEKLSVNKRLSMIEDDKFLENFICTGCKLCGSPLSSGTTLRPNAVPLFCQESFNRLHVVCKIYRPTMLYVRDKSGHIPLLVKNKAAEVLFGNISAEKVYACCQGEMKVQITDDEGNPTGADHSKSLGIGGTLTAQSLSAETSQQPENALLPKDKGEKKRPDFYKIWLILLKMLLERGKDSPFRFEIIVRSGLHQENGRFELVNFTMPCSRTIGPPD